MMLRTSSACFLAAALLSNSAFADQDPGAMPPPAVQASTEAPVEPDAPTTVTSMVADAPTDATPASTDAPAAVTAATPAATASSQKVVDVIGTPAPGKALIVFFRPSKFVGAAVGFIVRENDVELGKLRNGNFFSLQVEPGQHAYVVHSEAKDITNIETEAGETYFLSGSISMGFLAGRPNLSPADAVAFEAALPKLKPSKPLK